MKTSRLFTILGGLFVLTLACVPITGIGSNNTPTAPTKEAAGGDQAAATQSDLWEEAILSLRSVSLELVDAYPNREAKTLSAQIDSKGNLHLSFSLPLPEEVAATPDAASPGDFELFIIDGKAYTLIGGEGPAAPDDSYTTMLADTLLGPEGPGLWLDLLPEESFTPAGDESYAGFQTTKYTVSGQPEKGKVTGTIWVDKGSSALVRAEITVSGDLFFPPGSEQGGDVQITLTIQRADVPAIALP